MPKRDLPTCLFCGRIITPPEEKITDFGEAIYGKCECGAIYVCEPTGHNQGEALVDAMFLVSPEGIENVDLGVNFELRERDYDYKTHQYVYMKNWHLSGKIFFIKEKPKGGMESMKEKIKISKKDFIALLEKEDFETIQQISLQDKNILSWLISLSYDKENPISWKAIEAMGYVARTYVEVQDIDTLRNTIRKLLWSMTDESGGIGWRSAELIAEIIYADPSLFKDIIPILWSQREEESFLESVLRGIIRLSKKINLLDYINFDMDELIKLLNHKDETIRALTAIIINKLKLNLQIPDEVNNIMLPLYNKGKIIKLRISKAEKFL